LTWIYSYTPSQSVCESSIVMSYTHSDDLSIISFFIFLKVNIYIFIKNLINKLHQIVIYPFNTVTTISFFIFKIQLHLLIWTNKKKKKRFKFNNHSPSSSLLPVLYRTMINVTHTGNYLLFYDRISVSIYIYIYSISLFFSFLRIYEGQMIPSRNDDDEPDVIGMCIFFR
jgi:hypothetical protein